MTRHFDRNSFVLSWVRLQAERETWEEQLAQQRVNLSAVLSTLGELESRGEVSSSACGRIRAVAGSPPASQGENRARDANQMPGLSPSSARLARPLTAPSEGLNARAMQQKIR